MERSRLDLHRGGAGEPLVLVHGTGHTWRGWKPMLRLLEPRFDVLAVDLPGFGYSPHSRTGCADRGGARRRGGERAGRGGVRHGPGRQLAGRVDRWSSPAAGAPHDAAISPLGLGLPRENRWGISILLAMRWLARNLPAPRAVCAAVGRTLFAGPALGKPWRADPDDMIEQSRLFGDAPGVPGDGRRRRGPAAARAARARLPGAGAVGHEGPDPAAPPGPPFRAPDPRRRAALPEGLGHADVGRPRRAGRGDRRAGAQALGPSGAQRRRRERRGDHNQDEGEALEHDPTGSLAIGSPNTRIPPLIAVTLAAALVRVMTGTASPFCNPRAHAKKAITEASTQVSGQGDTSPAHSEVADRPGERLDGHVGDEQDAGGGAEHPRRGGSWDQAGDSTRSVPITSSADSNAIIAARVVRVRAAAVRERGRQQHETERREANAGPLAGADGEAEEPLGEHRQNTSPPR